MKKMDVLKASLCWLVLLLSCVTARADESPTISSWLNRYVRRYGTIRLLISKA